MGLVRNIITGERKEDNPLSEISRGNYIGKYLMLILNSCKLDGAARRGGGNRTAHSPVYAVLTRAGL